MADLADRAADNADTRGGQVSRRRAICSVAGVCVGAAAVSTGLAACGSGDSGGNTADEPPAAASAPQQGQPLARLADVPVGSGTLVTAPGGLRVMITQPSAGVVKAFDARCTHQRTVVAEPQNGIMTCPNHGSRFQATDGEVVRGPATAPLDTIAVRLDGQDIVAA